MTAPRTLTPRTAALAACLGLLALGGGSGCRQKMADQPYYRPLEQTDFFPDGRASRPLERGTVHRAQYLESDPIATGLTAEEWGRAYEFGVPADPNSPAVTGDKVRRAVGAPRYDQRLNYTTDKDGKRVKKATAAVPEVFVEEYPFPIGTADLRRGQERYTIFCAVCHGPLGNGQGKIWERGYLIPTSFHTAKVTPAEADVKNPQGLGISRGYSLWGYTIPMDEVPAGYIFEVITKGYGGMPSYSAQIPPADRWKIVAYVRLLQLSQRTDRNALPPEVKKLLDEAGGKK